VEHASAHESKEQRRTLLKHVAPPAGQQAGATFIDGLQHSAGNQAVLQLLASHAAPATSRPPLLLPRGTPLVIQRLPGMVTEKNGAFLHDSKGGKESPERVKLGMPLDVTPHRFGHTVNHLMVKVEQGMPSDAHTDTGFMNKASITWDSDEKKVEQHTGFDKLKDVQELGESKVGRGGALAERAVETAATTAGSAALGRVKGLVKNTAFLGLDLAVAGLGSGLSAIDSVSSVYDQRKRGKGIKETLKQGAGAGVGVIPVVGPYIGFARDSFGLLQIGFRKMRGTYDEVQAEKATLLLNELRGRIMVITGHAEVAASHGDRDGAAALSALAAALAETIAEAETAIAGMKEQSDRVGLLSAGGVD
jgi:hypothetical protein